MFDSLNQSPIPDWQKPKVILTDPAIWREYRTSDCDLRPVYSDLLAAMDALGIECDLLTSADDPLDIWIRDWGFVERSYFRYKPTYAKGVYPHNLVEKARRMFDQRVACSRPTLPLILDGGNLIHNTRTAILTEKVLRDNRTKDRAEVERTILGLGFEQVVFIPVEPEDNVGHADGILKFVSADLLFVNDYTGSHFADYKKRLMHILENAGLGARIVPFPWYSTTKRRGTIWSAEGCYINFILTQHGIVYPTFNHPMDEQVAKVLAENTVLPSRPVFASPLAQEGGVLNCITLNVTRTKLDDTAND